MFSAWHHSTSFYCHSCLTWVYPFTATTRKTVDFEIFMHTHITMIIISSSVAFSILFVNCDFLWTTFKNGWVWVCMCVFCLLCFLCGNDDDDCCWLWWWWQKYKNSRHVPFICYTEPSGERVEDGRVPTGERHGNGSKIIIIIIKNHCT